MAIVLPEVHFQWSFDHSMVIKLLIILMFLVIMAVLLAINWAALTANLNLLTSLVNHSTEVNLLK